MADLTSMLATLAESAVGFLITYLVHSTLLCGGALIVSLYLKQRALRLQEGLLRLALVGSVLTACLPLQLPQKLFARLTTAASSPSAALIPRPASVKPSHVATDISPLAPPGATPATAPGRQLAGGLWPRALCAIWLLGSLLLLLRTVRALHRLKALLADRRPLSPSARAWLCEPLPASLHVRLTSSQGAAVPLAMGVMQPEICLPRRALTDLDGELLRGAMLHEAAHILRRDPAWRLFGRLVSCLLWPQLLLRVVSYRLQAIAEYLCDDWSATRTGRPLVLARCLTEVAGWLTSDEDAATVPGMLHTESELARRVGRLVSWEDRSDPMRTNATLIPLGGTLLFLVACAAPRFVVAPAAAAPAADPADFAVAAELPQVAEPVAMMNEPPAQPAPPQAPMARRAPHPPAPPAMPRAAVPPIPPLPPRPMAAPLPPLPPMPPLPPLGIGHDETADSALSQKTAALVDAARRGDHATVERLEHEVEALAESRAQHALAALDRAHKLGQAGFPSPGQDADVDPREINREVTDAMREALRETKEQLREMRRSVADQLHQTHEREHALRAQHAAREAAEAHEEGGNEERAQFEAERAQLEAERAQLQAERAQLLAERVQLEAARRSHSPQAPAPLPPPPQRP